MTLRHFNQIPFMYFIYRVGQIIGGMLCNVLAYADDIVLLAPMWRGSSALNICARKT